MASIEKKVEQLIKDVEELKLEAEEIWIPIEENYAYFVSNTGKVKHYAGFTPKIGLDKSTGYCQIRLGEKMFKLHRLLATAFIPNLDNKPCVDHIDGDRQNNDLSNLRWCTYTENNRNTRKRSDNKSGFRGVSFHKATGKYRAYININGKQEYLGLFFTAEEASAVYEAKAKEIFGEFYCER